MINEHLASVIIQRLDILILQSKSYNFVVVEGKDKMLCTEFMLRVKIIMSLLKRVDNECRKILLKYHLAQH